MKLLKYLKKKLIYTQNIFNYWAEHWTHEDLGKLHDGQNRSVQAKGKGRQKGQDQEIESQDASLKTKSPLGLEFGKLRGWKLPGVALISLLFAIYVANNRTSPPQDNIINPTPRSHYNQRVAGIGVVEPMSESIYIGVDMPGVVREVAVVAGDAVSRGDPLIVLDQRDISSQIKVLQANVAIAKAQLHNASSQFAIVAGINDRRAVSVDEFNQRHFAKEKASASLASAIADLERSKVIKDMLVVRAPIDGTVLRVNIHPGEYASAGTLETPLLVMGDDSQLYVRVEFDEQNSNWIDPEAECMGYMRSDAKAQIPLEFVRYEPLVAPKANLAVAGRRVDTRVLQVLYSLPTGHKAFVGQQMDVFANITNAASHGDGQEK